ncbi:MAG TPA: TfoX/Sxy family protein [Chitinophaga sp.]
MAYDEQLADRVRAILAAATDHATEKKMFGGMGFMVNDKLCVGVRSDRIMVRISPEDFEKALAVEGFTPMMRGGRQMVGYGYVQEDQLATQKQLQYWINQALRFNQAAPVTPKQKK